MIFLSHTAYYNINNYIAPAIKHTYHEEKLQIFEGIKSNNNVTMPSLGHQDIVQNMRLGPL